MSKLFATWLAATGVGAAITLFAPSMIFVFAITIIGIPIAIGLLFAPLIFIVSLGGWFIGSSLTLGRTGYAIGAGAVLLALAVPPLFINAKLEQRAASFTADDRDALSKPFRAKVIAVRSGETPWRRRDEVACDGFCMRALMNGVAERVLFVEQDVNETLDAAMPARSFRLEKRATCPAVELANVRDEIKDKDQRRGFEKKNVQELMQLEIAKGNCLIEETVPLSTADVVLSRGTVHKGKSVIAAGLDPTADTVSAERLSVHERRGGGFFEIYRRTSVVTHLLFPVLAPTAEGAAELRAYPVLARYAVRKNLDTTYGSEPDWSDFLTATLKLDLALRDDRAEDSTRQVLAAAIAKTGPLDASAVKLGADFLDGIGRGRKMLAEDYPIARSVLTDTRFSVPWSAWAAIRYAEDGDDAYFDAIGAAMFKRLADIAANDDPTKYPAWKEEARPVSRVILDLPAATILKHRSDLDWLAKQERLRVWAHAALVRLNEFGSDAAPTLLWLMKEAVRTKDSDGDWLNTYAAGLAGLCRMGTAAQSMIAPIYEGLGSGALVKRPEWGSLIETLVTIGADPEDVWKHVQSDDRNQSYKNFSWEVRRARRRPGECALGRS